MEDGRVTRIPEFPLHMREPLYAGGGEMLHAEEMTVERIVALVREVCEQGHNWQPEHPQYIEGMFYLTQEQWDGIRAEWPEQAGHNTATAIWGIPVQVVRPYEDVRLPSGRVLLYSQALNAFCLIDPDAMPDPLPHPRRLNP